MAKFGYSSTSRGVTWNIPPVADFEDDTPGAHIPNAQPNSSGNADPDNQTASADVGGSTSTQPVHPAATTATIPITPSNSAATANDTTTNSTNAQRPSTGMDIPMGDDSASAQAPAAGMEIPPADTTPMPNVDAQPTATAEGEANSLTAASASTEPNTESTLPPSPPPPAVAPANDSLSTSKKPPVNLGSIKGINVKQLRSAAKILGWDNLYEEEVESRRTGLANLRNRLQEYFANKARRVDVADYPTRVQQSDGRSDKKFAEWQSANPNASDKEIREQRPKNIVVRTKVTKRMLAEETEEFRKEIKELADADYAEKLKAWEEKNELKSGGEKTAQEWGRSLQRWGPDSSRLINAVGQQMGLVGVTAWVGPNPFNNGQLEIFLTSAGTGPTGLTWAQFDPAGYKALSQSLLAFGKTIYNHKTRASRSIAKAERGDEPVWGTGDPTIIEDPDASSDGKSDSESTPQPTSRRAGKSGKKGATKDLKGSGRSQKRKRTKEDVNLKKKKKSKVMVSSSDEDSDSADEMEDGPASRTRKASAPSKAPSKPVPSTSKGQAKAISSAKPPATAASSKSKASSSSNPAKQAAPQSKGAGHNLKFDAVVIPKPKSHSSPSKKLPMTSSSTNVSETTITSVPEVGTKEGSASGATSGPAKGDAPQVHTDDPSPPEPATEVPKGHTSEDVAEEVPKAHAGGPSLTTEKDMSNVPKAHPGGPSLMSDVPKAHTGGPSLGAEDDVTIIPEASVGEPSLSDAPEAGTDKTTQALITEAWMMVYRYAENPEGNMAVLHEALEAKLGGIYEHSIWSKAVQEATDEDGDCEAAMARVARLAPAFVSFSQSSRNEGEDGNGALTGTKVIDKLENEIEEEVDELEDEPHPTHPTQEVPGLPNIDEMDVETLRNADHLDLISRPIVYNDAQPPSIWNHPNSDAWSPWISQTMQWYKIKTKVKEMDMDDSWVSYWEDLVEIWLDLEDSFRFEQYGEILSSKRPDVVDMWLADEREWPGITLQWDWKETQEGLKETQKWWEDVKPVEEKDEDEAMDWAPLDRTSGRRGFFMFLSMMFALIEHHYNSKHSHGADWARFVGDWMVLAMDMKETMMKVQEAGVTIPKRKGKEKAVVQDEPPITADVGSSPSKVKRTALEREIASLQEQLEKAPTKRGGKRRRDEGDQEAGPSTKRVTRSNDPKPRPARTSTKKGRR
ncbi:hypothetical protein K435DRAFT_852055 [Dendrothele bispora CBS 962.96]|uniref:Uncharacterized protein n=1 Tax=Dendrothele bispora (strain CBS 962.96) TaxID=1314807 RepID=A0A4V4HHL1_DENBC|nr:hypothetical protein K435DRAFT_852055 [Dendrothele bispora CBS 962.96]